MALGSFLPPVLGGLAAGAAGSLLAPSAPSVPQLPEQGNAAASALSGIGNLDNPWTAMQPIAFDQLLAMMQNPYVSQYMNAANRSGLASTQAGNQAGHGARMLMQDARRLYQSGFDPQNALRRQLQQRTTDQANVLNSMYGLQSSPYGAGVAGQDLKNFNIDWENQQLQRQLEAGQGIGQDVSGAQQLMSVRPGEYLAGGATPYGTYTGQIGDVNNALNQYLSQAQGGNAFDEQAIQDYLQYLGMGNAAANTAQNAFAMNQGTAGMYGAGLFPAFDQAFGNMFNPSASSNPNLSTALGTGDVSPGGTNWNLPGGTAGWGSEWNGGL